MSLKNCDLCGFCKGVCPIYLFMMKESFGPRGFMVYAKNDFFTDYINSCSLCGKCEEVCPLEVSIKQHILDMRRQMVLKGLQDDRLTKIRNNILEKGHPF